MSWNLGLAPFWQSPAALTFYGICLTVLGGAIVALFQWFAKRSSSPAEMRTAEASMQDSVNETVRLFMEETRKERQEERAVWASRLADLKQELELTQDQLGDAVRDRRLLEAENHQLRGDAANLKQIIASKQAAAVQEPSDE